MSRTLSEHDSKRFLAAAGVSVPDERLVHAPDDAVTAAGALGYPVALKLCGARIAHKTERGLVRLGVQDAAAVRTEAGALLAAARPDDGVVGVLVAPMVRGRRELIAGLVRDPQFGPCVMLGVGGIFAELLGDVAFAVAPLRRGDAADLAAALRHARLLGPFRGEPAVDTDALGAILEALGRIGAERQDVVSIDINPLVIAGTRPVVVDALVELADGTP